MFRRLQITALSAALLMGGVGVANAQYGAGFYGGIARTPVDPVRAATRSLLSEMNSLVEDMELDAGREPGGDRLLRVAQDVQDEAEHLARSTARGSDYNHTVQDFQEFDVKWHRLMQQATRFAPGDRRLQRNLTQVSRADAELHRLLRIATPIDLQELRALVASAERASEHLRIDMERDLRGQWYYRDIVRDANQLEDSLEHFEASIERGATLQHLQQDFEEVDEAWLQLAGELRRLSPARYEHMLREAASVAAAEGQVKVALGLEPYSELFARYAPNPGDGRGGPVYAARRQPVPTRGGLGNTPVAPSTRTTESYQAYQAVDNTDDADMSVLLGLLFGGNQDPKIQGTVRVGRFDDSDDRRPMERAPSAPMIKRVPAVDPSAAPESYAAPVPSKPIDAALQAKIDKSFAIMSAETRAKAMAQQTCPVSGELLGSHGVPIPVTFRDAGGVQREMFVCCEGCEDKLQEHPEAYRVRLQQR